jgi:hypothetical protein
MTLANDDLPQLKKHFFEWLAEAEAKRLPSAFAASALERIGERFDGIDQRFEFSNERLIRLEETLSSHIELTRQGFAAMGERFNAVDKRFESMQVQMDKRFEATQEQMNRRFDVVDKRFETMTQRMDKFMQWSFATMVATGGFVVAVLKLWPPVLP